MLDPVTTTNAVIAALFAAAFASCLIGIVYCCVATYEEIRSLRAMRRRRNRFLRVRRPRRYVF